jgi:large conductance mechanosensitive channel
LPPSSPAFVADLITPLLAAIGGKPNFASLSFTVNKSHFLYGAFINSVVTFLIIAGVVFFFVVKPVNAMMRRRRAETPVDQEVRQCPECLSEIPIAARRCAFCTTQFAWSGEPPGSPEPLHRSASRTGGFAAAA